MTTLTDRQLRSFYEDGYLHLRGAVSEPVCCDARQAINHSLWQQGRSAPDPSLHRKEQWGLELRTSPLMLRVFESSDVRPTVATLFGGDANVVPLHGVQIAVRFPEAVGTEAGGLEGHLDGIGTGTNGIAAGAYERKFTLMAVAYLDDVPRPLEGNFTVWPGSHRRMAERFIARGHADLGRGTPSEGQRGEPLQIVGRTGDVVLCHHLMVHAASHHVGPDIRYALVARYRHVDCLANGISALTDPWREWPGLRAHLGEI